MNNSDTLTSEEHKTLIHETSSASNFDFNHMDIPPYAPSRSSIYKTSFKFASDKNIENHDQKLSDDHKHKSEDVNLYDSRLSYSNNDIGNYYSNNLKKSNSNSKIKENIYPSESYNPNYQFLDRKKELYAQCQTMYYNNNRDPDQNHQIYGDNSALRSHLSASPSNKIPRSISPNYLCCSGIQSPNIPSTYDHSYYNNFTNSSSISPVNNNWYFNRYSQPPIFASDISWLENQKYHLHENIKPHIRKTSEKGFSRNRNQQNKKRLQSCGGIDLLTKKIMQFYQILEDCTDPIGKIFCCMGCDDIDDFCRSDQGFMYDFTDKYSVQSQNRIDNCYSHSDHSTPTEYYGTNFTQFSDFSESKNLQRDKKIPLPYFPTSPEDIFYPCPTQMYPAENFSHSTQTSPPEITMALLDPGGFSKDDFQKILIPEFPFDSESND